MSLVRVDALSRSFGGGGRRTACRAVRGVSFAVNKGECVGLIGRNGSGKTTLLRLLAGVLEPDEGEVVVDGSMAALIESTGGIELDATGEENLRNLLVLQGVQWADLMPVLHRAREFSELGEAIEDPVRTYSTGMVMRLAFAAVIFLEADLLLVDEVLSVGDPVFQRRCANQIRRFVAGGGTIILASHNYHEIAALCERVIFMDDGEIVIDGPADDVYRAFWQRNEEAMTRITAVGPERFAVNPLKAHAPLAENSHQIRIEEVRFVGEGGSAQQDIQSLSRLLIEIVFEASEAVMSPICRVQFHRADGLFVMGSNTARHGLDFVIHKGRGTLRLEYPHFPLAEGEYYVSVGLWPDEYRSFIAERAFDYHENAYVIKVAQRREHGGGPIASTHTWTLVGG